MDQRAGGAGWIIHVLLYYAHFLVSYSLGKTSSGGSMTTDDSDALQMDFDATTANTMYEAYRDSTFVVSSGYMILSLSIYPVPCCTLLCL